MAAVERSAIAQRPAMPPGYEIVAAGITHVGGTALVAGDFCYLDGDDGWKVATADEARTEQCAFAAQDYAATEHGISMLIEGEIDNYADALVPGAPLYPGAVAGDLDDAPAVTAYVTTPDIDIPDQPRIWAATATRIRFRL